MSWLKKNKPAPHPDEITLSAKEARKLATSSSASGYNVFESIRIKANAGGRCVYVNPVKLTDSDIVNLKSLGYNVRPVRDQSGKLMHHSIEW